MERGRQKLETLDRGFSRELMLAGRICFSCEQIFADRKCLEEHVCSATSYICSCGTEFSEYRDMSEHSTTHEPGHQVLDHETIKKRRLEKCKAEEEQLKRIDTGDVVWKDKEQNDAASMSFSAKPMGRVPVQPPQVPDRNPSSPKASFLPELVCQNADMKNVFADVGAPTVDLWTLYQPVVLLQCEKKSNKKKPYTCGKCGQCFGTKSSLMCHHNTHVVDKVCGCLGCGLLLSSKKLVPRFHNCKSSSFTTKFKIVTAKPPRQIYRNGSLKSHAGALLNTPHLRLSRNAAATGQIRHAPSSLQISRLNIRTFPQSNQGLHPASFKQLKSNLASAALPRVTVRPPSTVHGPNGGACYKRMLHVPLQWNTTRNPTSPVVIKPTHAPSAAKGFRCRVCHIPFETTHLLQRHKCVKAKEFMAQHARGGRQQCTLRRVAPGPGLALMNGQRKLSVPAAAYMKRNVVAVDLMKAQGAVPVSRKPAEDIDDDCYIVENSPEKPAEMICQVTSSVPIKT
ncbi:unnamed protein product [Tetraodon nigroviridis]|uniref:(spotted green pufferfish) hypothetical protein n=1 Tax=Tetraodon nigroviridis TaxID=99883 RepID=Q4SH17_TETNG|nr:unnamed protein product [Tetraodon nigroviridis]